MLYGPRGRARGVQYRKMVTRPPRRDVVNRCDWRRPSGLCEQSRRSSLKTNESLSG